MVVIIDEGVCLPKLAQVCRNQDPYHSTRTLSPAIKIALLDYLARALENPDDPDLRPWDERKGYRASQFTSGWILDWEVNPPEYIKLWDIRPTR